MQPWTPNRIGPLHTQVATGCSPDDDAVPRLSASTCRMVSATASGSASGTSIFAALSPRRLERRLTPRSTRVLIKPATNTAAKIKTAATNMPPPPPAGVVGVTFSTRSLCGSRLAPCAAPKEASTSSWPPDGAARCGIDVWIVICHILSHDVCLALLGLTSARRHLIRRPLAPRSHGAGATAISPQCMQTSQRAYSPTGVLHGLVSWRSQGRALT